MKLPPISGFVLIIVLWAVFYAAQGVYAADEAQPDVRVLIDISGSMKKTDPGNLRIPAAKLLLNLAKDDSRFGIWSFGQYVNNLVPSASVSPEWKKQTVSKADAINSAGLFTNVGLALERATMGQTEPDPKWDRTIVLLSDGMVDISKDPAINQREEQRILDEVIPKLKQAGFRVHAVALSDAADQDFLKTVALQTGGSFSLASNADELLNIFVEASDKVNVPEQVPLDGDSFSIDDSIKEFTALIFRKSSIKETQLISPDGVTFSLSKGSRNVSWFADKQYDLITVYNPVPGTWKVVADLDPTNRVTVVSDLNLTLEGLPENVLEGERLTMSMSLDEHGRVIANPNFLELMDITFQQQTASGETFEGKLSEGPDGTKKVPEDGVYSARLGRTITEGEHTFSVLVDGKTFKRKKSVSMMVHRNVLKVETQYRDEAGQVFRYLVTEPIQGLANPENLEIVAQITDSKGEKSIQNGVFEESGQHRIDVPPYGALGEYEVLIKVTGTSMNGKPFELVQGPYTIDYTPLGMTPEPVPAEPDLPIDTFDPSAMDIPSLDVEELPPDDIPPLETDEPVIEPEPEMMMADESLDAQTIESAEEESSNWIMLAAVFILGNVLVIGGGIFLYLKFLKKTDEEQSRMVEEITQVQQKKAEKSDAQAEPGVEPDLGIDFDSGTEMDFGEDEATEIRTAEEVAAASALVEAPEVPEAPEEAYVNEADPLELDEDEVIEVDDPLDEEGFEAGLEQAGLEEDGLDEDEALDDLDMMLSEQEGDEQTEEQLNQTIDEMLEQPTVFPESESAKSEDDPVVESEPVEPGALAAEENSEKPDKKDDDDGGDGDDKYPGFDHDEFMLDNPTKE